MPSGVVPDPQFRPVPDRDNRMSASVRLGTRLTRNRLDAELAHGGDPSATAELTLRAVQLRSRDQRQRFADALIQALGSARGPNLGAYSRRARRRDAAIRQAADELLALARRLREDRPIEIEGAAMAAVLVNDREGALHRGSAQELQVAAEAARLALDDTTTASERGELPVAA
jgi:hypothetical protein